MIQPENEFKLNDKSIHKVNENTFELRAYCISNDYTYFKGHFPNQPILPAIAIIDLCLLLIEKVQGQSLQLIEVESAKFLGVIEPGKIIDIFAHSKEKDKWLMVLREGDKKCAELSLVLVRFNEL